ncbi:hypothetical protein, partial [Thiolapillus sp.]|uniref:hypothetical protein n=2 Tax=Thiolapillus sp. TaxID=2017437 RepID=UPI003AF7ED49
MTAEKRIRALIEAARSGKKQAPVSRTMRVFNVLDDIEEALGLGISQSLIAQQLDIVNQRAKLTRNWGETASNFDHPLKSVILRFFAGVTWDCYAW